MSENIDRKFTIKTALSDYFQGTLGEAKLRQEIRAGRIPHTRVGTRIILRESALNGWMDEQEKQSVAKIRPLRIAR
jgi:excisionase family DNA binding protein